MKTKPILFSGPMVQAILDGRKTQTRRVIKFPGKYTVHRYDGPDGSGTHLFAWGATRPGECFDGCYEVKAPYKVGDVLWVREKWRTVDYEYCDCKWSASIQYADSAIGPRVVYYDNTDVGIPCDSPYDKTGWRPSIHMPREAARLFLRVTDVRAERVQEILCNDMRAEGAIPVTVKGGQWQQWQREYFAPLWDSIATLGYSWASNPWVWVYTFERITKEEAEHEH